MKHMLASLMAVAAMSAYAAVPFNVAQESTIDQISAPDQISSLKPLKSPERQRISRTVSDGESYDILPWEYGTPVYDIPEGGTLKIYNRSCDMFYYELSDGLTLSADACFAGEVVFYDNGDVYMRNMFPSMISGSYLVGKLDGNTITLDFPQVLCYEEPYIGEDGELVTDGFWPVFRADYNIDMEKGEAEVWIDERSQKLTFTINDDGSITQEEGSMFGVFTRGGVWYEEAIWNMKYVPFEEQPLTMPEGISVEKWAVTTSTTAYLCNIGFDGDKVYVAGLYPALSESVVPGVIRDGKVVLESPFYLGIDPATCHLAYFMGTKTSGNRLVLVNDPALTYDAEQGTMTYPRKYLVVNAGDGRFNLIDQLYAPTIYRQSENPVYTSPVTPEIVWVDDWQYDPWSSCYSWFTVAKIPNIDNNGNLLDTNRMWYNLYFDGELYWFDEEDYQLVAASTDVPYDYDDDANIFVRNFDHYIYFYWTGWTWMAVQSVFEDEEGNIYKSEMGYYGDVDGIDDITLGLETPNAVEYYDIYGRRLSHPQGLCIRKAIYPDGSVKSTKVMRR